MVGQFYTHDALQDWFLREGLPVAKEVISHFKTLNMLFSSFKDYEKKRYKQAKNIVFLKCSPQIRGGLRPESIRQLQELEESLLIFDIRSWPKAKMNHLKSRLCSDDYDTSLTPYTELVVAKQLVDKLGKDRVEIYPELETGKFSDVVVKPLSNRSIYLEIGNLGESLPERKIKKILDETAKHLGNKLKDSCFLQINIDTAELVFDREGHIDVKTSIEKTNLEMDRLRLDMLAGFEGLIILENFAYVINAEILEEMEKFLNSDVKDELELIKKPLVNRWVNSCKDQIAKGSKIIKSIIGGKSKSLLVEIHPKNFSPSPAATKELESFINHVIRHIKTQLEEQQLQPDHPNIVVVQGYNWIIFGFNDLEDIAPLYTKIKEFLNNEKEEHLSGIALFTNDFGNSIFISNEQAAEASKLSKDEVEELGMRYIG